MGNKTKELLEGLGNIVRKPSPFQNEKFTSYTNMYYPSVSSEIHKLPKHYDKAKRYKDEDGEEYIPPLRTQNEKKAFSSKRQQHYDEFLKMKEYKEKLAKGLLDEEDDEENDEEES